MRFQLATNSKGHGRRPFSQTASARTDIAPTTIVRQENGVGEVRYTTPVFTAFFNVSGDNQHLGFPGGRLVDPATGVNELVTARSGTDTPLDFGNQQGANATAGFTKTLVNGVDLIVDGGVRDKKQQAEFFGNVPLQGCNATAMSTPSCRPGH